eukprot:GILI01013680.1.p1 GENE.GILI01013680.1~~GILI01013680.1.p1  ORF type:complete len:614 (-),score=129.32 GILI01013680.1:160-2001(-)
MHFNAEGNLVYHSGALGITLDSATNTQKFFGSTLSVSKGPVDLSESFHTDDILSLKLSQDGRTAISGGAGPVPVVFVWDAITCEKKICFRLHKGSRGAGVVAVNADCSLIASVDLCSNPCLSVFSLRHTHLEVDQDGSVVGSLLCSERVSPDRILDACFIPNAPEPSIVVAGHKQLAIFVIEGRRLELRRVVGLNRSLTYACLAADEEGKFFAGTSEGSLVVVKDAQVLQTIPDLHTGCVVVATYFAGKVYTGGEDGIVRVLNASTLQLEQQQWDFNGIVPRGISLKNTPQGRSVLAVGLADASIVEVDLETGDRKTVMAFHASPAQVTGMDVISHELLVTSGEDNKICLIDPVNRKCVSTAAVSKDSNKDSQMSRAVAHNPVNGHIAVAHNDGTVTIRIVTDIGSVTATLRDAQKCIGVLAYSPDGSKLAVGSHDTRIYLYDVTAKYSLLAVLRKHTSFISAIDWSLDGSYIRSSCGANELLFYSMLTVSQDPNGANSTRGLEWATHRVPFGWNVNGIMRAGHDAGDIRSVDWSRDEQHSLIAVGTSSDLLVFRNPCCNGHYPLMMLGHSDFTECVRFGVDGPGEREGERLFTLGGFDTSLIQWKLWSKPSE